MILHAGRRIERTRMTRTTTLCGRMNARSRDGMNIAGADEAVTCKFCLAKAARLAKAQWNTHIQERSNG
ncbi:hypothetical protein [Xanthomonas vesicatoria]|uniref:Uncharacterized protein n=1 Tax=Xanthomonas vesicatoria TaxID=56460 RepID=A0ABS8L4A7_9XANT|nr:hypothetical protein [Xanthomonas vesicatoria]APO93355.1 hypothetical protein BI313_00930 [Xanthomonas vesicatoria]MCC8620565.1 hypothetical protein [Xanthomonas vesicatoria]